MKLFRLVLVVMFVAMLIFTVRVIGVQGINFVNYAVLTGWQGQFNYDFVCFIVLVSIWIMWRHNFSIKGIVLGLITPFGGILYLAPYLFIISILAKDNSVEFFIGKNKQI